MRTGRSPRANSSAHARVAEATATVDSELQAEEDANEIRRAAEAKWLRCGHSSRTNSAKPKPGGSSSRSRPCGLRADADAIRDAARAEADEQLETAAQEAQRVLDDAGADAAEIRASGQARAQAISTQAWDELAESIFG